MVKKHLKRLTAPRTWNILRKATKYILRPLPGKHAYHYSMSLNEAFKYLKLADTRKEVITILKTNDVFVDDKKV